MTIRHRARNDKNLCTLDNNPGQFSRTIGVVNKKEGYFTNLVVFVFQEGRASVIFCRNIDHWGPDDQWHIYFPDGEEVLVCVALFFHLYIR